jgi:uncharacterized LabA/DUF88 family protein
MNQRHPRGGASPARAHIAPVHRGPQAITHTASLSSHHAPNAALLIDFDNVTMGIRSDLQTELKNLLASDIIKGKVSVQRAYADWRRYPQYIVPLAESSIDMIMAPAYGSSKKNATDIRLAIDALELVFTRPEIGTFILLSGDSDFSSLVIKLKEYGKYVIGVGIRESSSDLLVMNCDEYYSYNALAGLIKSGEEEVVKRDPWELVTEAIARMKRNGDVMRADRLKQVMQQIDSSFDEKNLGMPKFSRFVSEAAQRGLLVVTRTEGGQYEVSPPAEGVAPASAAAAPQAEPAPREEGRRRGRGRGRGDRTDTAGGRGPREDARAPRPPREEEARPAAVNGAQPEAQAPAPHVATGDGIGLSGLRLTRSEALDLVRRTVESLTTTESSIRASGVRMGARELLGRDSESLSERNFERILRDAHDANVIDLRRRGNDYEVSRAVEAKPVSEQLEASAPPPRPPVPSGAPVPRGMGARGLVRGRAAGVGGKAPPPELLTVGMVAPVRSAAAAAAPAPVAAAPAEPAPAQEVAAAPEAPARGRKRPASKTTAKRATRTPVATTSEAGAESPAPVVEKTRKPRAKKASVPK